mmetsp:Transcript_19614/g.52925  ORF Transcript_19614/g.52925 Transcript_19614/m.52925 type:complete len:316 (-) Transcript_19614:394-1341(-)
MPAAVDRTREFHAIASSLARDRPGSAPPVVQPAQARTKSEFTRMTARIGGEIYGTTQKLEKLAQLAQSKSLFDDPTVEINELTMIIKQDLSSLNAQLREVQEAMRLYRNGGAKRQQETHTQHIVEALKLQLGTAAKGFQDVLHTRSENIKVQMHRQKQFDGSRIQHTTTPAGARPAQQASGPPAPLFTPPRLPGADEDDQAVDTVIDIGAMASSQEQVQALMPSSYLESRANAVESVQSTIVELGNIFQQLQSVVAEQQLMVERIDAETSDTVSTVDSTQRQLMRMYQNMSGNRLAMKVLAMLVFFMMLYGLFVA